MFARLLREDTAARSIGKSRSVLVKDRKVLVCSQRSEGVSKCQYMSALSARISICKHSSHVQLKILPKGEIETLIQVPCG